MENLNNKHTLFLEKIKIYARHGCMEVEELIGAHYEVNVWIEADLSKVSQSDDIADTVNYVMVNQIVIEEMKIPSKTLEHVCERIIQKNYEIFPTITSIKVAVSKLNPPVSGDIEKFTIIAERFF